MRITIGYGYFEVFFTPLATILLASLIVIGIAIKAYADYKTNAHMFDKI